MWFPSIASGLAHFKEPRNFLIFQCFKTYHKAVWFTVRRLYPRLTRKGLLSLSAAVLSWRCSYLTGSAVGPPLRLGYLRTPLVLPPQLDFVKWLLIDCLDLVTHSTPSLSIWTPCLLSTCHVVLSHGIQRCSDFHWKPHHLSEFFSSPG